jgi:MFS family permease
MTQPSRRATTAVLAALVMAEVVGAVEATMIFAALRTFNAAFGDPVMVGWIVTAFLLSAAASASVCSRLGDMFGRRRLLLIVLALAGVGSLMSAVATSVGGVIAGRAIQGVSGAVLPLCFGLVRENLPEPRVPFGIGVVSAAAFVSAGAAIFLGGVLVDHTSWHAIFYVGAATAAVAWFMVRGKVPRSPRLPSTEPVDVPGALLLVPAITGLLIALSQSRSWGWADARTLGLALASLATLALWLRHELRTRSPLIDVRLLMHRQLALANLGVVLLALGPLQGGLVLSQLLQQPTWTGAGLGLSATVAGLVLAPPMALAMVVGPGCGALAARRGARVPALWACAFLLAGWGGIALHHASIGFVAAMVVLQGIGTAAAYAVAPMLIVEVAPRERTSEVTGVSAVMRYIFNAVGSQVVAVMLGHATVSNAAAGPGTYPAPSAFELTLTVISLLCACVIAVTWALPRRDERSYPLGVQESTT